mgnify:CR=1 FL=1|jgi:transaldolase
MKKKLNTKVFADGANLEDMIELSKNEMIKGFTTNPSLIRKAGVENYENFCKEVLNNITEKPISFEVFADDFDEMERQADKISNWGSNVFVKIPVMNTKKIYTYDLIKKLSNKDIKLNITAIFTNEQITNVVKNLKENVPAYISVFAGRIADSGKNPIDTIKHAVTESKKSDKFEVIWASPRQSYNVIECEQVGCHIITATKDIIKKIDLFEKDLEEFSLETVRMFYEDAQKANYKL